MKSYLYTALLAGAVMFTACESDNDSNPVVQQPKTFELNTPAMATNTYFLEGTDSISWTYKQPDYGYTAPVTYYAQVSLDDTWTPATSPEADDASFVELDGSVTVCEYSGAANMINKAIMKLGKITEAGQVPANGTSIFIRMRARLNAGYECFSNSIELKVQPYFAALVAADPELWYLIGGSIGDGSWGSEIGTAVVPMSPVEGAKYDDVTGQGELVYTGYFTTSTGFKIVKVPGQWGDQWGGVDGDINQPRMKDADGEGADFKVPADGYYKITLNTKENTLVIVPAEKEPNFYEHLMIAGDFNGWATDVTMKPVNTVEGIKNHVWKYELDATGGDTTAKFLYDGWSPNWGSDKFPFGWGVNGGANIPVAAGNYTIIFNDIDGYYHFFSK